MKHKSMFASALVTSILFLLTACGGQKETKDQEPLDTQKLTENQPEVHGTEIKAGEVQITTPLNQEWVSSGKGIYEVKCQSCHRLTEEKLVGPGWKGVTKKREPHWIMNMVTNVDMMLESDPEAQKLLEQCLVRMPNQNVNKEDARKIFEFMRSNDGEK